MPNLKYLASTVPEILVGHKIAKVGHVTPHDHCDLIFAFFRYYSTRSVCVPNLKLRASTVPEILGGPKIPIVGQVTTT